MGPWAPAPTRGRALWGLDPPHALRLWKPVRSLSTQDWVLGGVRGGGDAVPTLRGCLCCRLIHNDNAFCDNAYGLDLLSGVTGDPGHG